MKSKFLAFTLIATVITFFNCKQTEEININIDYKYSDKPEAYSCKLADSLLIKEAIYSFENDMNLAYDKDNKGRGRSYSSFIGLTIGNRFKIEEVASKHSLEIAKALQKSSHYKNNVLLYNSELVNCLFNSIKNDNTKKSFEALRSANSLRPNVVLPTVRANVASLSSDKGLVGILAFDYYYNSLMLLNESQLKSPIAPETNPNVDFNKVPKATNKTIPTVKKQIKEATGHEGHNH